MEPDDRNRLSNEQFLELVTNRILSQLRADSHQRRADRRWWFSILITVAIGLMGFGVTIALRAIDSQERLEAQIEEQFDQPYISGLNTPFNDPSRLEIVGTNFGSIPGRVELYYEPLGSDQRSTPVELVREITDWTDSLIVVQPTEMQQNIILDELGSIQGVNSFDDLVPYIRVELPDGRRSQVW